MKVRVAYTTVVTDEQRRAIARYLDDNNARNEWSSRDRLATRDEIADFFFSLGWDNGLGVLVEFESR